MTTANNNTAIFRAERVTIKDMILGKIMMLVWRVRKAFQRKPKYYKDYIIRVK